MRTEGVTESFNALCSLRALYTCGDKSDVPYIQLEPALKHSPAVAYFAALKTLPFFITKFTCLSVEMLSSGFSVVAMMSAN